MVLEHIHSPEDVKALTRAQTELLCRELHTFLLESVAATGGHLASNLGAVELTVAIHRVFDTSRDRLVFDVGHQCYAHKALTGRMARFPTLRQYGGLSGFPKPTESVHDAFVAGHASNSVSVALGMARARTLLGQDYSVLALIGDGALSGGLAYEGLNNAGASGEPLIVILNDNGMSISRNVGAVSEHLSQLHGETLFEDMGFTYLGPIDGHDEAQAEDALRRAKALARPVLLHVRTVKGKGYAPAEREPDKWHGVGAFDLASGRQEPGGETFSAVFGDELCRLAAEDRRVCAITAAMCDGTGLTGFAAQYPDRFFDVGIAEAQAAAMAAGMAKQGLIPVYAVYSTFLQRAYDQLIHDTALSDLHVVFAVDRAGFVGADGETHHGIFDATFLSDIPNMTVLCPASFAELRAMLRRAVFEIQGPVAIRYPRGGEEGYHDERSAGAFATLREGGDLTLCAYGTMISPVLDAADILEKQGVSARVVKVNCISPFVDADVRKTFAGTKKLIVAEECASVGCAGQRLAAILTEEGTPLQKLYLCNLGKRFPPHGGAKQLREAFRLDAASIAAKALEVAR